MNRKIKNKRRKKIINVRLVRKKIFFFGVFSISSLIFLVWKTAVIGIENRDEYEKIAIRQQLITLDKTIYPMRGDIIDRNGEKIATSLTSYNVIFDIKNYHDEENFLSEEEKKGYLKIVSKMLDIDMEELEEYVKIENGEPKYPTHYKIIKKNISYSKGKELEESGLPKNIFHLENKIKRVYPNDNLGSQAIGIIRDTEKWGIEREYNDYLKGEYGREFKNYDNTGKINVNLISAVNGDTVMTTLDVRIQQTADEILEKYSNKHRTENSAMIVVNPNTGEVLALSNFQNFNNNDPTNIDYIDGDIFKENYDLLETQEEKTEQILGVWKNFAISDTYEPGSTFKTVVLSGALEEKTVNQDTIFYCPGYKIIDDTKIKCWTYETGGHGSITIEDALAQSCNIAIIEMNEGLERERFFNYQNAFGFGELTGIDLPNEVNGSIFIYTPEQLNEVEMATSAMGQGFNSTALQNTMALSAAINGGELLKPYIVSKTISEDGRVTVVNEKNVIKKPISKETSDKVREMLESTVSTLDGTGRLARIDGYNIGGKTGTAEQGDRSLNLRSLSFFAYFPVESPEYSIYTVLHLPEDYRETGANGVEPTKEMIEAIIEYNNIPRSKKYNSEAKTKIIKNDTIVVKDYTNRSIVEVSKELINENIEFDIHKGGSIVIEQIPKAGTLVRNGTKIFLILSNESVHIDEEGIENGEYASTGKLIETQDVVGLERDLAVEILEDLGFEYRVVILEEREEEESKEDKKIEQIEEDVSTIEKITEKIKYEVVSQNPSANHLVSEGTKIKLVVKRK